MQAKTWNKISENSVIFFNSSDNFETILTSPTSPRFSPLFSPTSSRFSPTSPTTPRFFPTPPMSPCLHDFFQHLRWLGPKISKNRHQISYLGAESPLNSMSAFKYLLNPFFVVGLVVIIKGLPLFCCMTKPFCSSANWWQSGCDFTLPIEKTC